MNEWKEAEVFADRFLPIPPRVCVDTNGGAIKTDRCLQCPMKLQCELKQSGRGGEVLGGKQ